MDYDTFYSVLRSALTLLANRKTEENSNEIFFGAKFGRPMTRYRQHLGKFNKKYRNTGQNIRDVRNNNRCLICKQKGHWKNECPNRRNSMTDVIKARVRGAGGNDKAAA